MEEAVEEGVPALTASVSGWWRDTRFHHWQHETKEIRLHLALAGREALAILVLPRPPVWVVQVVRRDPQRLRRPSLLLRLDHITRDLGRQPARAKRTRRTTRGSDKWPQKL